MKTKLAKFLVSAVVAVAVPASAGAQVIGLGTTKGGATAQVAAAISKVVTTKSDLQMRTQAMGGTQQYIPIVNAGELPFGLSNMPQYWMAWTGTGLSEGKKYDNLRIVATMMVFRVGAVVAAKSDIRKASDFRGKRIPYGFNAAPLFNYVVGSMLANGDVGYDSVTKVPAVGLPQHWGMFKEGKLDLAVVAVGTGVLQEMNAVIDGGIRYVSLDPSDPATKRTVAVYPGSYLKQVQPAKGLVGVMEPVYTLHFDYLLWAHKDVKDDVVYKVVKAMYDNEADLKATGPLWRSHASKTMAKDQGAPYHPGALKFYKEAGLR
jgi:TRAP transporter TAXI family solute receptor